MFSGDGAVRDAAHAPSLEQAAWYATPAAFADTLSKRRGKRWNRARHLNHISSALADLVHGQRRRLLLSIPPRHGKSELGSHWFPLWALELHPDWNVILTSHTDELATHWGRQVRNTITDHADSLRVRLRGDSAAAHRWDTTQGGGMYTAGVGGGITGRGANLLICDDPIKDWEQAQSPTYLERLWDWWTTTAYTRLEPNGAALVIHTRWCEKDLIGRLLEEMSAGGEQWDSICLPALAEEADPLGRSPGEPLWPERYGTERLNELAGVLDAQSKSRFAGIFQQNPATAEDRLFAPEFIKACWDGATGFRPAQYRCRGCGFQASGPGHCTQCNSRLIPHDYVTAWDVARKRDWVVGITWDTTAKPAQIVAFERFRRVPWPEINKRMEARAALYPGIDMYDSTGPGDPLQDFLKIPIHPIVFSGSSKPKMLEAVRVALESGEFKGPREGAHPSPANQENNIRHLWSELEKYTWDDERLTQDCVMTLAMLAFRLRYGQFKGHIL